MVRQCHTDGTCQDTYLYVQAVPAAGRVFTAAMQVAAEDPWNLQHSVMIIDDFEMVKARRAGVPHASLQLLSRDCATAEGDPPPAASRPIDLTM